jgi:site-specific DNA-methyltransferase (adenine-specific)
MTIDLRLGDCLEVLKTIPDNSVDSVVTDPPYHLTSIVKRFGKEDSAPAQFGTDGAYARASKGFMGKEWDGGDIAFRTDVWEECLRILKPGGHLLAFSHSRTYHRMGVAIEDAGFEIRDQIMWVYGSGFPKSHNIGKAIDKIEGNEREVVSVKPNHKKGMDFRYENDNSGWLANDEIIETKGNSEWEGWGTALKPAHEPIVMARKPLSEKSIAENVLKHGTGGINIDGSRIEMKDKGNINFDRPRVRKDQKEYFGNHLPDGYFKNEDFKEYNEAGRFPANIIFDEESGQLLDKQSGVKKSGKMKTSHIRHTDGSPNGIYGKFNPNHPISETYGDEGGASRFFYCPKAAKKDRDEGLDNFEEKSQRVTSGGTRDFNARCANCGKKFIGSPTTICDCDNPVTDNQVFKKKNNHPTVKPTDLMRYLINLVTPPNGTILDPFMGSGSTGKAAVRCGVNFIGIEKEQEYMDIASARIEHERNKPTQTKLF